MAKDTSIRAFKCPSCSAPLEPQPGKTTMKCQYCGETVIIPESARIGVASSEPISRQAESSSSFSGETYSSSDDSTNSRMPMLLLGGGIAAVFLVIILGA